MSSPMLILGPLIILLILIFVLSRLKNKYKKELKTLNKEKSNTKFWIISVIVIGILWAFVAILSNAINKLLVPSILIAAVVLIIVAVIKAFINISKAKKLRKAKR